MPYELQWDETWVNSLLIWKVHSYLIVDFFNFEEAYVFIVNAQPNWNKFVYCL